MNLAYDQKANLAIVSVKKCFNWFRDFYEYTFCLGYEILLYWKPEHYVGWKPFETKKRPIY